MRNFKQLQDAIIEAIPLRAELEALTDDELEKLRRYGNCFDNTLYMATPAGKKLLEEVKAKKAATA